MELINSGYLRTTGSIGNPDKVGVWISSLTWCDDSKIHIPSPGITAIVGSNNSGKSTALQQILAYTSGRHPAGRVKLVNDVDVSISGSSKDLFAWLTKIASYDPENQSFTCFGVGISRYSIEKWEDRHLHNNKFDRFLHTIERFDIAHLFVHFANAQSRLDAVRSIEHRDDTDSPPEHYLHRFQDDSYLLARLNEYCRRVFQQELTLDDLGKTIKLRVDRPRISPPRRDLSQHDYRKKLAKLQLLNQQGDGMISFIGLLIPLIAGTYKIVAVDEPEAFFHPPQAYALGIILGELARESNIQILLATHDRNLLAGLITSGTPLTVIRLDRQGNRTTARQLETSQLASLWTDPVLRYSNVLDGLFHEAVVIAESEVDCRFYEAALHAYEESRRSGAYDKGANVPPTDVHFVAANGKFGMARFAKIFKEIGVPVVVVPDLDVLRNPATIQGIVKSLGYSWEPFEANYRIATSGLQKQDIPVFQMKEIVSKIADDVLNSNPNAIYDSKIKRKIEDALRAEQDPWEKIKKEGCDAIEGDNEKRAINELLDALDKCGVIAVRVGELEQFAKLENVGKGRSWLSEALSKRKYKENRVQEHIERILRHIRK